MKYMDYLVPFKRVSQLTLCWVGFNNSAQISPSSRPGWEAGKPFRGSGAAGEVALRVTGSGRAEAFLAVQPRPRSRLARGRDVV